MPHIFCTLFVLFLFLGSMGVVVLVLHLENVKQHRLRRAAVVRALSGLVGNVTLATTQDLRKDLGEPCAFVGSVAKRLEANFGIMKSREFYTSSIVVKKVESLNPSKLFSEMGSVPFGHYRFLVIAGPTHLRISLLTDGREWLGNYGMGFDPTERVDTQIELAIEGLLNQLAAETRLAEAFPAMG